MADAPKIRVSREEFAEALFHWLCLHVGKEGIENSTEAFDLKVKDYEGFSTILRKVIGNKKDFDKVRIFDELFALNMWIIVRACERIFEDIDKRNECLDIFHRIVYEKLIEGTEENLGEWMNLMGAKYIEYIKAMETEHSAGPAWVLATVINKNLFGKVHPSAIIQVHIGAYVAETIKALTGAIKKYEIE